MEVDKMIDLIAAEIEHQIKLDSAEMDIDLEEKPGDPLSGIFPAQREAYRRWAKAIVAIVRQNQAD